MTGLDIGAITHMLFDYILSIYPFISRQQEGRWEGLKMPSLFKGTLPRSPTQLFCFHHSRAGLSPMATLGAKEIGKYLMALNPGSESQEEDNGWWVGRQQSLPHTLWTCVSSQREFIMEVGDTFDLIRGKNFTFACSMPIQSLPLLESSSGGGDAFMAEWKGCFLYFLCIQWSHMTQPDLWGISQHLLGISRETFCLLDKFWSFLSFFLLRIWTWWLKAKPQPWDQRKVQWRGGLSSKILKPLS